jgi:hypothetical protein
MSGMGMFSVVQKYWHSKNGNGKMVNGKNLTA